jgi:DNA-binding transcriptional ArsR family regulator
MPYGLDVPTIEGDGTRAATGPDYDAPAVLRVSEPEQLRALADELRNRIIGLLRERARSTQQLAEELGIPKGTIGHHLKVLEKAGLIHVVRTRQVRAVTEKFYGRTARLFLFDVDDPESERALGATLLREAAREVEEAPNVSFGHPAARLLPAEARRLERRLHKLMDDFLAADDPHGALHALAVAFYERGDA